MGTLPAPRVYNVNVGVLGHVDSGKTSLVAALSTTLSTAALDKHPQSKERGITLDLGFSSFAMALPDHLQHLPYDDLQVTLVDCPGHASLIRTIIGGAQIINMMLLVVDVTRGIQTQTAECLVVGELATKDMIVVLNKVDQLPQEGRAKIISKAKKRLSQTLNATKFAGCAMVPTAAKPGTADTPGQTLGIQELIQEIVKCVPVQPAAPSGPFKFAIDHCFAIRGQGTVLTGTVLSGSAKVGDSLELPELKINKKVKSMQMFKRPVQSCKQGDRVGICVTQLDATWVERGIACTPGSVPTFSGAVAAVDKIRFFVGQMPSRMKVHVTIGHQTVMGLIQFFGLPDGAGVPQSHALHAVMARMDLLTSQDEAQHFDTQQEYVYQDEVYGLEGRPYNPLEQHQLPGDPNRAASDRGGVHHGPQWGLLTLTQPITASEDAVLIGSRLDASQEASTCRLAFYGRILKLLDPNDASALQQIKIYKLKQKRGSIDRVAPDGLSAVCKGMFKRETDISLFCGLKVTTANGEVGTVEGSFGKSGKFKVQFPGGLNPPAAGNNSIQLTFKKFIFDKDKKHMAQ
ncbi:hypothetical protein ABBQ38_014023 [Trebouxia sp. C0009 RCD-2024]